MEEEDRKVEGLHRDAATGKLRIKRRDRGIGLEDESDSEDDEHARMIRSKNKRKKLNNDNIDALC